MEYLFRAFLFGICRRSPRTGITNFRNYAKAVIRGLSADILRAGDALKETWYCNFVLFHHLALTGRGEEGPICLETLFQVQTLERAKDEDVEVRGFRSSDETVRPILSLDIHKGYWHLRLHPLMRDWFVFRYAGRYYQCVALLIGWDLSPW